MCSSGVVVVIVTKLTYMDGIRKNCLGETGLEKIDKKGV